MELELKKLITIPVYLRCDAGRRVLMIHNGVIIKYCNTLQQALEIINHPASIFELDIDSCDYEISQQIAYLTV